MKEKTKNIFKTITLFTAFALIVGLVTTVTVGENEETFICETDRLLDAFTIQNAPNAYPNGTDSDHPAYTTGLEYSVSTENGEGTLLDPYEAAVSRGTSTATTISLPEYYQVGTTYYKVVGINHDGFNAQKPAKNEAGSEIGT